MNHLVMDKQRIQSLTEDFAASSPVLIALGDETRIHIVLAMLSAAQNHEHCEGMRVGELAKISSLSRPAISHHIKILKEAGIIKRERKGAMNFYYLDPDDTKIVRVIACLQQALAISQEEKHDHGHS
jgi:ArsR family transcriptional regulator